MGGFLDLLIEIRGIIPVKTENGAINVNFHANRDQ
jgi:hypothetical protein